MDGWNNEEEAHAVLELISIQLRDVLRSRGPTPIITGWPLLARRPRPTVWL